MRIEDIKKVLLSKFPMLGDVIDKCNFIADSNVLSAATNG